MKKLVLLSAAFFTTISLLTACGEKGTGNATDEATKECCDSTTECTPKVDSVVVE